MAVKPLLDRPLRKPDPTGKTLFWEDRDDEQIKLIKDVWFHRFDEMFCDSIADAEVLWHAKNELIFEPRVGIFAHNSYKIDIHPNINKKHLNHISKKVRAYLSRNKGFLAIMTVLMTNIAIELIEMGAPRSIIELYYNSVLYPDCYEELWFAEYKEVEND